MLKNLIFNDLFKQKRTKLLLMIILIPLCTNALLGIDFFIRYKSYLYPLGLERGMTSWQMLLKEEGIVFFSQYIPLFSAIILGSLFETEYKNNGFTLALTEPIKRENIILSKFLTSSILSLIMITINILGLALIGIFMKFPEGLALGLLLKSFLVKMLCSISIMTIHLFLTLKFKNTLISIGISAILCFVSEQMYFRGNIISKYNPYGFGLLSVRLKDINLLLVLLVSISVLIIGLLINFKFFNSKESY